MTYAWKRTTFLMALSLVAAAVPMASSGAQSSVLSQLSLFGGVNAASNGSPFAGSENSLNAGAAADISALPFTIRLTGEFDQVKPHGGYQTVVSGAADVLSPSVGLFHGARLYAFGGPGVYRYNGYRQSVPIDQGLLFHTVPTMTRLGVNAGFAVDFAHVFIQAKGVMTSGMSYVPVSIGFHF